jgi:RNA polymerase-associated protein LEO1
MSDSEDPIGLPDEGGDDLFGDDEIEQQLSDQERPLSDPALDSDRDEDEERNARDESEDRQGPVKTKLVMGLQMYRHRTPKPKDGTVSCRCSA